LNVRNEIVALLSSGIRFGTLVKPFVAIGLTAVALLYINEEFFMPHAYAKINFLKDLHSDEDAHRNQERNVQSLEVENGGRLIFHSFNTAKKSFFDVYWVKSVEEIFKIKYLYPAENGARGEFIDYFQRAPDGEFALSESFDKKEFPDMQFDPNNLRQSMIDPRQEPISELFHRYSPFKKRLTDFQARASTNFYNKLVIPWLCFLAAIGPIPYCFRYTRQLPIFMIYLVSMMTLVSFYLIMNSALLFGENQVFSPFAAIVLPFGLYFGAIYTKYKSFIS
jgi:lipopolysaccharide export system permease protein